MKRKLLLVGLLMTGMVHGVRAEALTLFSIESATAPTLLEGSDIKYLTQEGLQQGSCTFLSDFETNQCKKRILKYTSYTVATPLALYFAYVTSRVAFETSSDAVHSTIDFGKKLFGVAKPVATAVATLPNIPTTSVPVSIPSDSTTSSWKKFIPGAHNPLVHIAAQGTLGWFLNSAFGSTVQRHINEPLVGFFEGRTVDWCLKKRKVFVYGKKATLHAAALNAQSPLLTTKDSIAINLFPNDESQALVNGTGSSLAMIEQLVRIKNYAELRSPFIAQDNQERDREINMLKMAWNTYVDGIAYVCGRIDFDIQHYKKQNVFISSQLNTLKKSIIETVNATAEQLALYCQTQQCSGLYDTIHNCVTQCEQTFNKVVDTIDFA